MLKAIVVGLGPIGVACARAIRADSQIELVGLVDIDPEKLGKPLDDLGQESAATEGASNTADPMVAASVDEAMAASQHGADVAIVTTTSRFAQMEPLLEQLLKHKLSVVTSCEEMAYPRYAHAELADRIDALAKAAGKAVLGTGVNPGFVMDSLAVTLSSAVRRVQAVRCVRRVDAARRRLPLQAKVGATMTPQRFEQLAQLGKIGHQGIAQSVALLAAGFGRQVAPGSIEITLEPVIADRPMESGIGLIEPGRVAGMHNVARWSGDDLSVELDLTMAVGVTDPRDVIELQGPVCIRMKISGGLPGDSATVAMLVNYAQVLDRAQPGLLTMLDLPPAGCRGRDR